MTAPVNSYAAKAAAQPIKKRNPEAVAHGMQPGPQADVLALQRSAGNQAVSQLLESAAVDPSAPVAHATLPGGGQTLDPATQILMEERFGADFGQVRIHTDAQAAESARAVQAKAYTMGQDVVFSQGRYAPATTAGKRLLAHELAHVVQQEAGKAQPVVSANAPHEKEAAVAASAIADGHTGINIQHATGIGLARTNEDEEEDEFDRAFRPYIAPSNTPSANPTPTAAPAPPAPMDQRHVRGHVGEQTAAFQQYRFEDGWAIVRGPSGSAGHGVTTHGEDILAYNVRTGELDIADNKNLSRRGNVASATAIDPTRNLPQNLVEMIAHVESQSPQQLPNRQHILRLLRQTQAAVQAGQPIPGRVRLAVINAGGRSTGVTPRLQRVGITPIDTDVPVNVRSGTARPQLNAAQATTPTPATPTSAGNNPAASNIAEDSTNEAAGKPQLRVSPDGNSLHEVDSINEAAGKPQLRVSPDGNSLHEVNSINEAAGRPQLRVSPDGNSVHEVNSINEAAGRPQLRVSPDGNSVHEVDSTNEAAGKPQLRVSADGKSLHEVDSNGEPLVRTRIGSEEPVGEETEPQSTKTARRYLTLPHPDSPTSTPRPSGQPANIGSGNQPGTRSPTTSPTSAKPARTTQARTTQLVNQPVPATKATTQVIASPGSSPAAKSQISPAAQTAQPAPVKATSTTDLAVHAEAPKSTSGSVSGSNKSGSSGSPGAPQAAEPGTPSAPGKSTGSSQGANSQPPISPFRGGEGSQAQGDSGARAVEALGKAEAALNVIKEYQDNRKAGMSQEKALLRSGASLVAAQKGGVVGQAAHLFKAYEGGQRANQSNAEALSGAVGSVASSTAASKLIGRSPTGMVINTVNTGLKVLGAPETLTDVTQTGADIVPANFISEMGTVAGRGYYQLAKGAVTGDTKGVDHIVKDMIEGRAGKPLEGFARSTDISADLISGKDAESVFLKQKFSKSDENLWNVSIGPMIMMDAILIKGLANGKSFGQAGEEALKVEKNSLAVRSGNWAKKRIEQVAQKDAPRALESTQKDVGRVKQQIEAELKTKLNQVVQSVDATKQQVQANLDVKMKSARQELVAAKQTLQSYLPTWLRKN